MSRGYTDRQGYLSFQGRVLMRVAAAILVTVITFFLFVWTAAPRWGDGRRPWPLAMAVGMGAGGSVALWLSVSGDLTLGNAAASGATAVGWIFLVRFGLMSHESVVEKLNRRNIRAGDRSDVEELRSRRQELKRQYRSAYDQLSSILFEEDPIGINFEKNSDEYEPEVGTILPRLPSTVSVEDVRRVVHEEFVRWFDHIVAGPPERYQKIAERLWAEVVPPLHKRAGR